MFSSLNYFIFHVYVGPILPVGASYLFHARRQPYEEAVVLVHATTVGWDVLQDLEVVEILSKVQYHMDGLIHGFDETIVDQVPMRLQWHTIGVSSHIFHLLGNMACVVSFYHEPH